MGVFLLDNLKYFYDCDQTSDTRFDSGPNGLDVAQIGFVSSNPGARNLAVDTTGNPVNYLAAVHNDLFRVGDNPFTLTYWMKIATGQEFDHSPAVGHYDADGVNERGYFSRYQTSINKFTFTVSADGIAANTLTFGTTLAKDIWNFVVCTHDPVLDVITLEVNRAGLVSTGHSGGIFANTSPFTIGAAFLGGGLQVAIADVDEIGAWDRQLNSDELDALHGSGTPPGFSSFVGSGGGGTSPSSQTDSFRSILRARELVRRFHFLGLRGSLGNEMEDRLLVRPPTVLHVADIRETLRLIYGEDDE